MPGSEASSGKRELLEPSNPADGQEEPHTVPQEAVFSLKIGDVFADRYEIRGCLGCGTFGEVYSAFDRSPLQRLVALKIIRRIWTDETPQGAIARKRFLNEPRIAGNLSHSRIATVYEAGEFQGRIFVTQELVPDRDLRRRVEEDGPLSVRHALVIILQVCDALSHAHSRGVIHQDIKPGNILVGERYHTKITDFGMASATHADDSTDEATLPGVIAGTPGYMAPEQLTHEPVDARADIFAVGCVLYKILTAHHPFEADTTSAVIEKTLHAPTVPPSRMVNGLPEAIDRICLKATKKDRHDRYETVMDLARDVLGCLRATSSLGEGHGEYPDTLGWDNTFSTSAAGKAWSRRLSRGFRRTVLPVGVTVVAVVLVLSGSSNLRWRVEGSLGLSAVPAVRQVAVLPFTVTGNDAQVRAFADGLTETVTAKLSQLGARHPLQVVPVSELRSQHVASVEQARKEFGVNLVIAGTLQRSSGIVRVTPVLIDAVKDRQLAGDAIDASDSDTFAVEDRVVSSVLAMLEVAPGSEEHRDLTAHGTAHPVAYDYYLQGRGYLLNYQNPESIESAIAVFGRALNADSNYALADAGLGRAYWYKYTFTHESKWVDQAHSACERAVQIQPTIAAGHACLGLVYDGTGRYDEAAKELKLALKFDPTDHTFYMDLASAYEHLGSPGDAEQTYRQAIALRPQFWGGYNQLGAFYYGQQRYRDAIQMFSQAVALAPDNARAYSNLGGAYLTVGRYADAIPVLERSITLQPTPAAYSSLASVYFQLRRFSDATPNYQMAVRLGDASHTTWGNLADAEYLMPGKRTQAVQDYQKAIALAQAELRVNPKNVAVITDLADYYSMLGERESALRYLKQALVLAPNDAYIKFEAAQVYNQLGDRNLAIQWLQKALRAGYSRTVVRDSPFLDNLRSDSRVSPLLAQR